jgi:glycosyltransferase 2 family protein
MVFSPRAADAVLAMWRTLPTGRLRDPVGRLVAAVREYAGWRATLVNVLAGSIAVQALRIVQAYFLGRAIQIDAPMAVYFAFIPLILLVMLLPITINGLGTSQAAFVWFFARAGVAAPSAFALSVLFVALGIVGNLPGGLLCVRGVEELQREKGQGQREKGQETRPNAERRTQEP